MLTEITHRHGKLAGRHVEDLYALLEAHGDDAMRSAIERAVVDGELTVVAYAAIYPPRASGGTTANATVPERRQPRGRPAPNSTLRSTARSRRAAR
ncbi:MAG: hypothetical protein U0270_17120 [Labilithrix sp.]